MTREFAREDRVRIAHLLLDECMSDAAHLRCAAVLCDDLLRRPTTAQVIEDNALLSLEDVLCDEDCDHVHRNDVALLVDEAGTISVTIESDAEIERACADLLLQCDERIVFQGVGFVVRECAIERIKEFLHLNNAIEDLRLVDAHGVRHIGDDLDRSLQVSRFAYVVYVVSNDVVLRHGTRCSGRFREGFIHHDLFDVLDACCAADRNGLFAAELESIPFCGVV